MLANLSYSQYVASYPLTQQDVIDHIIKRYHPDASDKQALFIKQNLTLILEETFKFSKNMSFSKMTVRDLQKATGISMGTLYNTFGSKEQLESMIVDGLAFIIGYSSDRGAKLDISAKDRFSLGIKAYVFMGSIFRQWYYFASMEFRTMSEENLKKIENFRLDYLNSLVEYSNGNLATLAHISTIIQDYNVRYWKYKLVDIDEFADHCVKLAKVLNDNAEYLGDLQLEPLKPSNS